MMSFGAKIRIVLQKYVQKYLQLHILIPFLKIHILKTEFQLQDQAMLLGVEIIQKID